MTYALNPNIGVYVKFMMDTMPPMHFEKHLQDIEREYQAAMKEHGFKDINQMMKAIAIRCNE